MELVVRIESRTDFAQVARLAAEGFGGGVAFDPARLAWLYERAFSQPARVLALHAGERKVGQVVLLGQSLAVDGGEELAVALIDLFILPEFRSREAIAALYGEAERLCLKGGVRAILAVPNGKAVGVNRRFLKLETAATLDIRAGLVAPFAARAARVSRAAADIGRAEALALFARYLPNGGTALAWTPERLLARLQDPAAVYGIHATDDLLLVASPRVRRGIPFVLLCGLFARPGATVSARHVRAVASAACRFDRRPLFVYVGRNGAIPLPGLPVPQRLRPSLMIVQSRDLKRPGVLGLDRFEALDFDFA